MSGLSLDPAGNHFVLRNEKPDGTTATMSLSPDEVVTLAAMVPTMIQTAMAMIRPLPARACANASLKHRSCSSRSSSSMGASRLFHACSV